MFDGLRNWAGSKLITRQASEATAASILSKLFEQSTPPTRGSAELIAAYKASPWLRAVCHKIAIKIASVPWFVYSAQGTDRKRLKDSRLMWGVPDSRKSARKEIKKQPNADIVPSPNHPLVKLLDQANPVMSGLSARKVTQIYIDLKGESFWVVERNAMGVPVEYWPMPPNWIVETPTKNKPYFVLQIRGSRRNIPANDVIWFKDIDPANPYGRGTGVGESLGDEIETDEFAAQFVKATFFNRARPELLVGIEGAKQPALDRASEEWNRQLRGFNRNNRAFFHGGKMSVTKVQQSFEELQLSELRRFERDALISVYGVPPELMGILENSNRATITEARNIMATEVLIPRLEFLRSELQLHLAQEFDDRLYIDYESPAVEDLDFHLEAMKAAPWAAEVGEWREMMGLPHRGDQDRVHMIPAGLIPQEGPIVESAATVDDEDKAAVCLCCGVGDGEGEMPTPVPFPKLIKGNAASIDALLEALRPGRLNQELDPIYAENIESWGTGTLQGLGITEQSFLMLNPLVADNLRDFSTTRIVAINETGKDQIKKVLIQGFNEGLGGRDMARQIRSGFEDMSKARSLTIARTEINRGANFGTFSAYKQSGVVEGKRWIAAFKNTRPEHAALHNTVVGVSELFEGGGGAALYPMEFGIAKMDINCQCTIVAVLPDISDEALGLAAFNDPVDNETWELISKDFDAKTAPGIDEFEKGLNRAWTKQADDLIEAYERLYG